MAPKELFIFDVDGTLVNAYTAIWKSLNFTLRKLGYRAVSFQKAKRNVGKGDELFMRAFFSPPDVAKALKIYRAHHKIALLRHAKLMPYAASLLSALKKNKIKVAIASNRPKPFTDIILRKTGLLAYVDYCLCADQINSLKPNPKILNLIIKRFQVKKEAAVFVGDMDIDLETAKRAKVDAIFVKGGSSPLKTIKKYKNKKIVSSLRYVQRIFTSF